MRRREAGKEYWTFPGGGVEAGEMIEAAVLRELKEETTIEAKIMRLLYHQVYPDSDSEHFFYLCKYISGIPRLSDNSNERAKMLAAKSYYNPEWVALSDLEKTLLYPLEIRDWLLQDLKEGFKEGVREATLRQDEIRETI